MAQKFISRVDLRAEPDEIERWKTLAHDSRVTLSRWIRDRLNDVAPPEVGVGPTVAAPSVATPTSKKQAKDNSDDLMEKAKSVARQQTSCLRRVPTGTFCKSCGRTH